MCVDPELLGHLSTIVDTETNEPNICCWVDMYGRFGVSEKRVLYGNESHIMVFNSKGRAKTLTQILCKTWFELKRIVSPNSETLQIMFDKIAMEIRHQTVPFILRSILQYICSILIDKEMPEVDLDEFDYTILQKSQFSVYYRFRAIILSENVPTSEDLTYRLKDFVSAKCDNIDVYTLDPHGHHIPYILRSLQVNPKIHTLTVQTPLKGCLWKDIGDFVSYNTSITSIITYEPFTTDFEYFVQGFKNNPRSKVKKIAILRAKVTRKYNKLISQLLDYHKLETLSVSNSLSGPSAIDFVNIFENSQKIQAIRCLLLDGTKGMDISQLMRISSRLKHLSICNCGMELCLLFGFLSFEANTQLQKLSCSGNYARINIKEDLLLPSSIKELDIQNVDFKGDNLLHVFIMASHNNLKLDVSRAILHEGAWGRLTASYDMIQNPNFSGIGWSENPITLETLDFFDRCENLDYLNIGGCMNQSNAIFPHAMTFIANNTIIKKLDLSGTTHSQIQSTTMPIVISTLRENRSLTEIDLSGNGLNNAGLTILGDVLLNNRIIKKINYNTMEITDGEVFKNFFHKLANRGTPLDIPYPAFDIHRLLTIKVLKDFEATEIDKNIEKIIQGDPTINIPPESINLPQKSPKMRRVPARGEPTIPSDAEVELNYVESDPQEWEVIQLPIPHPNDDYFISLMKQSFDLDLLVDSIIGA